ncbi:MAG: 16S rRNA (uracil(1498)-N(3))-methyltransferase [Corallococcus sp.]|nr:16S rRNA (uracil(1498)-N(3))-methyltransferase [Corallococcus sp.]
MSEYRRFFIEASQISDGEAVLCGEEYEHAAKVLRMKSGDCAFVCTGDGREHFCEITSVDASAVHLRIIESRMSLSENTFETTLFMGVMKGDKNDFIVQKSVELGINEIVFFESRYTVAKFEEKKLARYRKISREASKQCGRAKITKVSYCKLQSAAELLSGYDLSLFCYEKEMSTHLKDVLDIPLKRIAVIVGAEGGFSEEEAEMLTRAGAVSVTLGKRILRAETAPIYVASVLCDRLNK